MSMAILATKLYIPPPRTKVVCRPRLLERLNEGTQRKLTLISAPAGFGKTTLVSEWIGGCRLRHADPRLGTSQARIRNQPSQIADLQFCWLSLDEADSEPARFLTYLVSALRRVVPNIGEMVLGALHASQPIEPILTDLLNEVTTIPNNFVLVLDDYHRIDSRPIDSSLSFLLEHMPPQMHLIITTREDPQLPLARLRARGQLTELRASDLRFTADEAVDFINQVMGLDLTGEDIAALETRTEGWIAGLQLAALALAEKVSSADQSGVSEFIQAFAGDHRYIVDYLVEEVLQRQPEPVRSFFLQTAILDRMNGSLCDAVTGQDDGCARLETLRRGNFFVVPLDDKRHWYRYHHLFAEVLSVHLMAEQPDQVAALHRRASVWFEKNGLAADAIHHALVAEDFERAADLIEPAVPGMRRNRQEVTLLGWFQALPDELLRRRPVLSGYYGGVLLQSGGIEGVETRLRDAERWLDIIHENPDQAQTPPDGMIVVDEAEFLRLPSSIAAHRAGLALIQGDVAGTMKYARRALDLVTEKDHLGRGAASALMGLASWWSGDLGEAHRSYSDSVARLLQAGHFSDVLGCTLALADIRIAQGRLRDAMRTHERGLQLSAERGAPTLRGTADMHVGMSKLFYERNELNTAVQHLLKSKELGEHAGLPQNPYRWRVAMARIQKVEGDLDSALSLLNEAERLYVGDFSPNIRPIAAIRTRLWVIQGRLGEAFDWAREQGLSAEDNLSYLREFEHITLARLLLAQAQNEHHRQSMHETHGLLERLLQAAQKGGRLASEIEILLLQALTLQTQGEISPALTLLKRALVLAYPEGFTRIFVDEGDLMRSLLLDIRASGEKQLNGKDPELKVYVEKLLSAFAQPKDILQSGLGELLSQREMEVLRLVALGLSNREISERLFIALSSVKGHNQLIFSKLQVQSRTEAVARARELRLL